MFRVFMGLVCIVIASMGSTPLSASQHEELPESAVAVNPHETIEVIEFFSYGCRQCFNLEEVLDPWIRALPTDVYFNRLPAMFGGRWDVQGQLFLTLKVMAVDYSVHHAVFEAVRKRQKLTSAEEMADFLATVGVDKDLFIATYHSPVVQAKVIEAKEKTQLFEVSALPTMVVNGKHCLDLRVGGVKSMLQRAERLTNNERLLR